MAKIDQQIELLLKSVEKWHNIVNGAIDQGWIDCPLCRKYRQNKHCPDCPLYEQGGEFYCRNTSESIYQRYCEDRGQENAEEMVNMLEYIVDLYHIKRIHDNS